MRAPGSFDFLCRRERGGGAAGGDGAAADAAAWAELDCIHLEASIVHDSYLIICMIHKYKFIINTQYSIFNN